MQEESTCTSESWGLGQRFNVFGGRVVVEESCCFKTEWEKAGSGNPTTV